MHTHSKYIHNYYVGFTYLKACTYNEYWEALFNNIIYHGAK